MNFADWYTDRMEIRRARNELEGSLTVQRRETVAEDVPCRIYHHRSRAPRMQGTAAYRESAEDRLSCGNEVDVEAGDELLIRRGGQGKAIRAFAGEPARFYEPFGAVVPGLAHQEIALLQMEYLKGEVSDGAW